MTRKYMITKMRKNPNAQFTMADWAIYNGFCLPTQYKLARLAGYTLQRGRNVNNLFTVKDNEKMLMVKPTVGRPRKIMETV